MDVPSISVIVPVYNSEKYLERCINSILAQTFIEFECLLVDDCSTDNSLEICNNFKKKDNRIKVYHKKFNEGTAQARKTGVLYAVAEFIIFADNDDWIEPIMLEELYNKIISNDYDMVCCDFISENSKERIYRKQDIRNRTNTELIREIITWENFFDFLPVTWNKLVKAKIYKRVDFPKTIYSEDRAIIAQVLYYCNKIGYINKGLYHWCNNQSTVSASTKRNIQNLIEDYICYTEILLFVIENKINTDELAKEITKHIDCMGFLCYDNKKILDVYRNSLNKIFELKTKNQLTEEILMSEQSNVGMKMKKLNKIMKPYYLFLNFIKKIIPRKLKEKIKIWLNH
jgi:glycosyltransferase involved in cell wall biosynthesis